MFRVRIGGCDYDALDPRALDGVGAWWCPAIGATWFKCYVKSCSGRISAVPATISNGVDFRVRFARMLMPTSPDDSATFDEYCPHHWIGRSASVTLFCKAESNPHHLSIEWFDHMLFAAIARKSQASGSGPESAH